MFKALSFHGLGLDYLSGWQVRKDLLWEANVKQKMAM